MKSKGKGWVKGVRNNDGWARLSEGKQGESGEYWMKRGEVREDKHQEGDISIGEGSVVSE